MYKYSFTIITPMYKKIKNEGILIEYNPELGYNYCIGCCILKVILMQCGNEE